VEVLYIQEFVSLKLRINSKLLM